MCRIEKTLHHNEKCFNRDFSLGAKKNCYILLLLLNGAEGWANSEAMEKRIKTFEMWLENTWTDHITINELLNRIKCQPQLLVTITLATSWEVERKRASGRTRISWLANFRTWQGLTSSEVFRCATNNVRIAVVIANIRNGWSIRRSIVRKPQHITRNRELWRTIP